MAKPVLFLLAGILLLCADSSAQDLMQSGAEGLLPGHWIEAKGSLDEDKRFVVTEMLALEPERYETLVGTLRVIGPGRVSVLGQSVHFDSDVEWDRDPRAETAETRIKVEGYYRGPRKFSARAMRYRGKGRDLVSGRIDAIETVDGGTLLRVMKFILFLPDREPVESEIPLDELPLATARVAVESMAFTVDDDDDIPGMYVLGDYLTLGARLEFRGDKEDEYDLNRDRERDRIESGVTLRNQLIWLPPGNFRALIGFRHAFRYRDTDGEPFEERHQSSFNEAYGYWSDVGLRGLDLQVGRQDFDEPREWIYDQNLDAARVIWRRDPVRLELSASTVLRSGGPRDEATDNLIGYLSNGDPDRHLAAYVIDRRDKRGDLDYPIHFGARALGQWLPNQEVWAEFSTLRGYEGQNDLRSSGFDVGTTWYPPAAEDWYFTAGYAFGEGDANPNDDVDRTFRQTGLNDNNGTWGGVTSFRYYGELFDPDLMNIGVTTLGIGKRLSARRSLDLVFHRYAQDELSNSMPGTGLRRQPNGLSDDLGWEVDLVYGDRTSKRLDIEFVLGMFQPGGAFPDAPRAFLARIQLRLVL